MNPNVKCVLIAYFTVGVNYDRLIGGKCTPLRHKGKRGNES